MFNIYCAFYGPPRQRHPTCDYMSTEEAMREIVGADAYKAIMVKIKAYEENRFEGGTE